MSLFKTLSNAIPDAKALVPVVRGNADTYLAQNLPYTIGAAATMYPADNGETYINKGYRRNAIVYAIVSKCAKKFAQVPWYHYKIKYNERKTWQEYEALTKEGLNQKSLVEARKMRTKAVDQVIVDSALSKKLARPNRNQSRSQLMEQWYGFKLLTGEGNVWLSEGFNEDGTLKVGAEVLEIQIIPKSNLNLIPGEDMWDINGYEIEVGASRMRIPKENVIMWKFPTYKRLESGSLEHLRGMSPLEAAIFILQGSNEGAERLININKNQGAAGLAFNKDMRMQDLNITQSQFMRSQFDSIVNNKEMAGRIAVMNGDWNYLQFGMDVGQLRLLEQMEVNTEWLCNVLDFPPGLLTKNQTHENQREQKRELIYSNIATAAYSLRDELNAKLLTPYGLDRETNVIDAGVMELPEMVADLKEQVTALKDANWLTLDEKRVASGYEALNTPESTLIFMPSGLQTLEDAAAPMGGPLDTEGLD